MAYFDPSMLPTGWQILPFGQFLKPVARRFTLEDDLEYRVCGVRWYGKGVFVRETLLGRDIKRKDKYTIRSGDVIYNKLFAWQGSFAIVGSDCDGCCVSDKFPMYHLNDTLVLPGYLRLYFQTKHLRANAAQLSKGVAAASKFTLNPSDLPKLELPLPPLDEQRRIIARIEALAERIAEARGLQEEALKESEAMIAGASARLFSDLAASHPSRPIGETFKFRSDLIRPGDGSRGQVRFIGLQHIEPHTGRRIGEDLWQAEELAGRKFKFSPGEVVYGYLRPYLNKVWIADCEGLCSVDQYVLKPRTDIVDTDYLAHFMRSRVFVDQAIERTHSLILPRLHSGLLASISIPVPPITEQRQAVRYLDDLRVRVDALRRLQESTQAELAALLPAVLDKAFRGEL